MHICLDCLHIFAEPKYFLEPHGFTDGQYEHRNGCPFCGGTYITAKECSQCGSYISNDYIQLKNGDLVCENCFKRKDIGDDLD